MANVTWGPDLVGGYIFIAVVASVVLFGWSMLLWHYPFHAIVLAICSSVGFVGAFKLIIWLGS